jgi:hypothetical protein
MLVLKGHAVLGDGNSCMSSILYRVILNLVFINHLSFYIQRQPIQEEKMPNYFLFFCFGAKAFSVVGGVLKGVVLTNLFYSQRPASRHPSSI